MELHEETDGQLSFAEDVVNHPSHYWYYVKKKDS